MTRYLGWRVFRSKAELIAAASGLALMAGASTSALAQDKAGDVSEVVVTASRVQQLGFEAPTPTTVLGSDDIKRLGVTSIGQLTAQMPQFIGDVSPSNSAVRSGGGGSAFNLRGLGSQRTLFLVNSRRHVPNNPNGTTDNNVIPSAIIDRVEVVTGGASAAWGSDAVAGVVNVILKDEIDGFEVEALVGSTAHGDNEEFKGSLAWGTRFASDRGRFMIAGEYGKNGGILDQSDRDWGREGWAVIPNPNYTAANGQFQQLLVRDGHNNNATYGGLITTGILAGTQFGPGGAPIRYNTGSFPIGPGTVGGDGPQLNLALNILVPIERYAIYTRTTYEITDSLTMFVEGSIGQSKADYALIENFHFGDITINADNAFLPQSLRTALLAAGQTSFKMGRIDSDFGSIRENVHNATRRIVAGFDGQIGEKWRWNTYYQYGDDREVLNEGPIVKVANYALAADAVLGPNGQIVCRSTLTSPANGCVPINLFGSGSPSPSAISYVTGIGHRLNVFEQQDASFSVQGPFLATWAGPIAVAGGVDFHKTTIRRTVDPLSQANGYLIGNPKNITGSISVKEIFGEAVIPLLKDQPFVKSLQLDIADRYVDYSTTGTVNTWKIGLDYAVNDDLRFRATRSRDIRAPNPTELFAFGGTQFASIRDTLTGRAATQVQLILSPNPGLVPEEADTTTVGVVYEPSWLPRLRLSIDHYKIDIQGAIASVPAQDIVDRCANGNQALCQAIIRNAAGDIITIQAGRVNLTQFLNSGVDMEAAYSLPMSDLFEGLGGNLTFRALANYVHENISNDGRTKIDKVGSVSDQTVPAGIPHWRANGSIYYSNGPLNLIANMRYVGGGRYSNTFTPTSLNIQKFSGRGYLDLGFEYMLRQDSENPIQLFGHVNNVFDNDPPIIPGNNPQSTLTNYALYDTIGRTFLLGARFKY